MVSPTIVDRTNAPQEHLDGVFPVAGRSLEASGHSAYGISKQDIVSQGFHASFHCDKETRTKRAKRRLKVLVHGSPFFERPTKEECVRMSPLLAYCRRSTVIVAVAACWLVLNTQCAKAEEGDLCKPAMFATVAAGIQAAHSVPSGNIADLKNRIMYLTRTLDEVDTDAKLVKVCDGMSLTAADYNRSTILSEILEALRTTTLAETAPAFMMLSRNSSDTPCSGYLHDVALSYLQLSRGWINAKPVVDDPALQDVKSSGRHLIADLASTLGLDIDSSAPSPSIRVQGITISSQCAVMIQQWIPRRLRTYGLR